MNPGLLRQPVTLIRRSSSTDDYGQRVDSWADVLTVFSRLVNSKARPEIIEADQQTERQTARHIVRSRPFLSYYQDDDRIRVEPHHGHAARVWGVSGWRDTGQDGEYIELTLETPETK